MDLVEVHDLATELKKMVSTQKYSTASIAAILSEIKQTRAYTKIDGGYASIHEMALAKEYGGYRKSTVDHMIAWYRYFSQDLKMGEEQILALPYSITNEIMPALKKKTKEEALKIVDEAIEAPRYIYERDIKKDLGIPRRPYIRYSESDHGYVIDTESTIVSQVIIDGVEIWTRQKRHSA